MVTIFFESSSNTCCWYAWLMSSFMKAMPPASVEKISSTLGSAYCSNFDDLFATYVQTGTIGAAYLDNFTGLTGA